MRALVDTNVVLDVLLRREPWLGEALAVWDSIDQGRLQAYLPASALTDIYYVGRRLTTAAQARTAVRLCLETFEIAPLNRQILERAQNLLGPDFEDDVQIACAELAGLDGIVTRDPRGFAGSSLEIWSPRECLDRLRS